MDQSTTFVKGGLAAPLRTKIYSACCRAGSTYEDESATGLGGIGRREDIKQFKRSKYSKENRLFP